MSLGLESTGSFNGRSLDTQFTEFCRTELRVKEGSYSPHMYSTFASNLNQPHLCFGGNTSCVESVH